MKATTQTREVMVPGTEEVVVLELSKDEAQALREMLGARSIADSGKSDILHKVYRALREHTHGGIGCKKFPLWSVYPDAD